MGFRLLTFFLEFHVEYESARKDVEKTVAYKLTRPNNGAYIR